MINCVGVIINEKWFTIINWSLSSWNNVPITIKVKDFGNLKWDSRIYFLKSTTCHLSAKSVNKNAYAIWSPPSLSELTPYQI